MNRLFEICCRIMDLFAAEMGWSYKEANVYAFIWLEPALVVLSALILVFVIIKNSRWNLFHTISCLLFTLYGLFCIWIYIFVLHHYNLSPDKAFDLAVAEMNKLSVVSGASYEKINIFLFICFMPAVIIVNLFIAWLVTRHFKKKRRSILIE